ncbi:hypothetical protein KKA69_03435 [Patescibacteria group bacterium]|nr:hypothetical protein [Patescibacteria group bacterium]
MKILILVLALISLFLISPSVAEAVPFKAADKNPNVVAHYEEGVHGIPVQDSGYHEGEDLVTRAGKSGVFQQWFYGEGQDYEGDHGHHSVWKQSKDGCPPNWFEMTVTEKSGSNFWGDYLDLEPGDYCIHTNDFRVAK